ncbi:winged helix-turn-helix domain-containing protein [Photobacterium sp. MCCC 1A19761]|uniref:winged helix-turn-helix domain-containing protein n=1 Tax=Photobacterium sp. MCCC 1A19761 TaxID=3115000 RepID=UPI00307E2658
MWEFRPEDAEQLRHRTSGEVRSLQPSESRLLLLLLAHPHRTVTKQEIHDVIWPDKVVSDESITRAISTLRAALDDNATEQNVIRTVPKAGYFVTGNGVTFVEESLPAAPKRASAPAAKPAVNRGRVWICLMLLLVNVLLFDFLFLPGGNSERLSMVHLTSGNTQFIVESDDLISLELMSRLNSLERPDHVDFYITSNQARIYVSCVDRTPKAERRSSINFSIDIEQSLEYISHEILQQCQ